jgi:hypothetical protein
MQAKKILVSFFASGTGTEPVRDWLKSLEKADRLKIGEDIRTVELGWPIGMPVCKPLGHGLYEVRTNLKGPYRARVIRYRQQRHDSASRLHQEIAGNAERRSGTGTQTA